jgi:hypothetical protein
LLAAAPPFAFAFVEETAVGFAPGFLLVPVVFEGIVVCDDVPGFCDAWFVGFDAVVVDVVGGFDCEGVAVAVVGATSAIVKKK